MKKKITSILLAAAMVSTMFLSACGGSTPTEPTNSDAEKTEVTAEVPNSDEGGNKLAAEQLLRINLSSEPPSLDPGTSTDTVSTKVLNSCYDGLVRINKDGEANPGSGIAESWELSEDLLTYTFKLRDAKWSDGSAVTAEDFEYSWKRVLDPNTASQYAFFLYYIEGAEAYNKGEGSADDVAIKAIDEKTLEVKLARPTAYFPSLTARPTYFPLKKEAIEKSGDAYGASIDNMVFNGPFKLVEWNHEQNLALEKNENYWDAETVKLARIEADMIGDKNTPVNLFETNELDAMLVSSEFLPKYRDAEGFKSFTLAGNWYLQCNMQNEFMANKNIRKALSMALNRKGFVEGILHNNGARIAPGLVPYGMPGKKSEGGDFRSQSPLKDPVDAGTGQEAIAKAAELFEAGLAELGKTKEDFEANVNYLTGDSDAAKKIAQAIQQMWKQALGVEISIESTTFKVRLDKERKGDYAISFSGWSGDYNDAMTFAEMWVTDGPYNRVYWSNAEYDALIDKAQTTVGDERIQAMLDAELLLAEDEPIIMIYYPARNVIDKPYVHDIYRFPVALEEEYKWAYISEH
ncbi:MAG: peptide ABC transporter substrate-binding protein [Tissierellales bacterium]|jgi:oligopeptide transport system substrate-binding protein|nr:peptide ABC transporter substrate-binding protein [Tissierellales bacterium]